MFEKLQKIDKSDRVLCLTHIDLDGTGAPILLRSVLDNEPIVRHCQNARMSEIIKDSVTKSFIADNYDKIIVTDISCSEEDAKIIDKSPNKNKLILLDHHVTASHLNAYDWAVVEDKIPEDSFRMKYYPDKNGHSSGTSLLYDYLDENKILDNIKNVEKMQELTHLIASYDTWDWKNILSDEEPNRMNKLCNEYGLSRFEDTMVGKIQNNQPLMGEFENLLIEIAQEKAERYAESLKNKVRTGTIAVAGKKYDIAYVFGNNYMSDVFEMMEGFDKDINIMNFGDGISLRTTRDNVDVSEIAKQFGGGGHVQAAGLKYAPDEVIGLMCHTLGDADIKFDPPVKHSFTKPKVIDKVMQKAQTMDSKETDKSKGKDISE